jgi:hypothetical protein
MSHRCTGGGNDSSGSVARFPVRIGPSPHSVQATSIIGGFGWHRRQWEGNSYYFGDNGESVIGYQRHAGTVIALADPVCPSARRND